MLIAALFSLLVLFVSGVKEQQQLPKFLQPEVTKEIKSCLSPLLEEEEWESCRFYAAVVDAGSTGTRLHLFEFSHDIEKAHSPFKLEQETFKEVKPGLSSLSHAPNLAAESIRELLIAAKGAVPENLWMHTPITLKATAGLRLLEEEEAESILAHVEEEVANSGLLFDDESVGILSGTDEGVFGWFTLNFLLDRLEHDKTTDKSSVAALDLGGGSTQVTFAPPNFQEAVKGLERDNFSHKLRLFGRGVDLYTHSYLGNGLVAARLGTSKLSTDPKEVKSNSLFTHCLPVGFKLTDWDYAGNKWTVGATKETSFANCLQSTQEYLKNTSGVVPIPQLAEKDVYLFSYFYDRGVQAGVISVKEEYGDGRALVSDYKAAAERACALPAESLGPEHWKPWQCLDLTYIYSILHYGYGLPDTKSVNLVKKVKHMEVSWALGAGFHLLNSYHDKGDHNLHNLRAQKNNETSVFSGNTFFGQLFGYISQTTTHILVLLKLVS